MSLPPFLDRWSEGGSPPAAVPLLVDPGGPITGETVVPCSWRNSPQVVPCSWRATCKRSPRRAHLRSVPGECVSPEAAQTQQPGRDGSAPVDTVGTPGVIGDRERRDSLRRVLRFSCCLAPQRQRYGALVMCVAGGHRKTLAAAIGPNGLGPIRGVTARSRQGEGPQDPARYRVVPDHPACGQAPSPSWRYQQEMVLDTSSGGGSSALVGRPADHFSREQAVGMSRGPSRRCRRPVAQRVPCTAGPRRCGRLPRRPR